ncbi:hypothetical protein F4809DRAFT_512521 [Biscogniauxia mediterranea]|nr:hypothetical protein F4809DRAFT_512521 [Biscogniauxia mediterranea]
MMSCFLFFFSSAIFCLIYRSVVYLSCGRISAHGWKAYTYNAIRSLLFSFIYTYLYIYIHI